MAQVDVQTVGGSIESHDAVTVGDLRKKLSKDGFQVTVNGDAVGDDFQLRADDFVAFSKKVAGAAAKKTTKATKKVMPKKK